MALTKRINYIKRNFLVSWNEKMDKILLKTLKSILENIENEKVLKKYIKFNYTTENIKNLKINTINKILPEKIYCKDIDKYKESISDKSIKSNLEKLQKFYSINYMLFIKLKKCKNLREVEEIINKYWKDIELDIVSLTTILKKCENVFDCNNFLSQIKNEVIVKKEEFINNSYTKAVANKFCCSSKELWDMIQPKYYHNININENNWFEFI